MIYQLNENQFNKIMQSQSGDGGYQSLIRALQNKVNKQIKYTIELSDEDIEKIKRYKVKYGNGGWENLLNDIFPDIY